MTRRKLPIGIQTFQKVREEDCYYVDKTAHISGWLTKARTISFRARGGLARACFSTRSRSFSRATKHCSQG